MSVANDALFENVSRHLLGAIALCLTHHYRMPALTLVYCGIDVFASLNRASMQPDTTRSDFIAWCDRYLLPGARLDCTAADLYSARCAVLHTYTSKSLLSRMGKAREIIYAWGNKTAAELQRVIDVDHKSSHVAVHIESLAAAFEKAVHAFLAEALQDPARAKVILARSRELFFDHERII